jgi:uncharacterized RDD family membrane protein YckC
MANGVAERPAPQGGPPSAYSGGTGPSGPRANFGQRLVAALVDGLITGGIASLVGAILNATIGTLQLLNTIVSIAYFVYLEGSASGQTVGKRLLGIRVVDFNSGGRIDYGRAAIRYFARILSALPFFVGYLWMLWDRERQTWHDKLTTTVVVPTSDYPVERWPG